MAIYSIDQAKINSDSFKQFFMQNIVTDISSAIESSSLQGFNRTESAIYPKIDQIDGEKNYNNELFNSDIIDIVKQFTDAGYKIQPILFAKKEVKFIIEW